MQNVLLVVPFEVPNTGYGLIWTLRGPGPGTAAGTEHLEVERQTSKNVPIFRLQLESPYPTLLEMLAGWALSSKQLFWKCVGMCAKFTKVLSSMNMTHLISGMLNVDAHMNRIDAVMLMIDDFTLDF